MHPRLAIAAATPALLLERTLNVQFRQALFRRQEYAVDRAQIQIGEVPQEVRLLNSQTCSHLTETRLASGKRGPPCTTLLRLVTETKCRMKSSPSGQPGGEVRGRLRT